MDYSWHDVIGNIGVFLILLCYYWLQAGKIRAEALSYSVINALGAALLLISLWFDFNLSAVFMELAWLLLSMYGMYQYFDNARRKLPR